MPSKHAKVCLKYFCRTCDCKYDDLYGIAGGKLFLWIGGHKRRSLYVIKYYTLQDITYCLVGRSIPKRIDENRKFTPEAACKAIWSECSHEESTAMARNYFTRNSKITERHIAIKFK